MSNSDPRRRSDAAQNRELIVAAATAALAESDRVSLNAIAKRAGVANATLYRHFPTRESLVFEVLPGGGAACRRRCRPAVGHAGAGRRTEGMGAAPGAIRDD